MSSLDKLKEMKAKELEEIKTTNKYTSLPAKQDISDEIDKATFYLTKAQIKAIDFIKAHLGVDKSEYVREKLNEVLPKEYMDMAKEFYNK